MSFRIDERDLFVKRMRRRGASISCQTPGRMVSVMIRIPDMGCDRYRSISFEDRVGDQPENYGRVYLTDIEIRTRGPETKAIRWIGENIEDWFREMEVEL